MTIASGINTVVSYKKQAGSGLATGGSGAQELRRVSCEIDLSKDTYESQEKAGHTQVSDFRHGVRRVPGTLSGELSPGSYADFFAAVLRKDFAAGGTITRDDISAEDGPPGEFNTVAGDFLSAGFKVGDVVRCTGWTATGNNGRNYRITALTATKMTVGTAASGAPGMPEAVTTEAAGNEVTIAVVGKKSFIPTTGHTSDMFSFEKWFPDINQSERYYDVRVASVRVSLPATGMATVSFGLVGKDMSKNTTQYFTTPNAPVTTGITAAVNGFLRVGSADLALVTGLEFTIDLGVSGDPVVGSNVIPSVAYGKARVTGQFTAYFEDGTLRDAFIDETPLSLNCMLTTNNDKDADFLVFNMSRIKVGGANKSDPDTQVIQTLPFTALLDTAGGSGAATERTTVSIQDSSLS